MNPFDLPGPPFLRFYLCFAIMVIIIAVMLRRRWESYVFTARMEKDLLDDPYAIAYLHSGKAHMVSVTALSLLNRGLLVPDQQRLATADGLHSVEMVRRPIEKALLQRCMTVDPLKRITILEIKLPPPGLASADGPQGPSLVQHQPGRVPVSAHRRGAPRVRRGHHH